MPDDGAADDRQRHQPNEEWRKADRRGREHGSPGDEGGGRGSARADQQSPDEAGEDEVARVRAQDGRKRGGSAHTVTWSRSAAMRFSPMPGMRSSSFTDPKPPCCSR